MVGGDGGRQCQACRGAPAGDAAAAVKEINVVAWCDGDHDNRDGRAPADIEVRISVNGGPPRLLDLCRVHDAMLADLMAAGAEVGPPAPVQRAVNGRPTLPSDSLACPECGYVGPNRSALGAHLKSQHGTGIRDYARS